jgi:hypothetical protein
MNRPKMTREESLARAVAGNRRKRLNRLADELRENGFVVIPPEDASNKRDTLPTAA